MEIRRLFAAHRGRYGSPRITADLREEGWRVSENTVAPIMAEQGLVARPAGAAELTRARPGPVAGTGPGRAGLRAPASSTGSGTATAPRSPPTRASCILDSVLDMGSRRIVGFALGEHHDADLAYAALAMAVAVRGGKPTSPGWSCTPTRAASTPPAASGPPARGSGSASRWAGPGRRWTTRSSSRWHSTLEFELRRLEHFATRAEARAGVAAWIEEYNHDRRHSAIGMLSPIAYERAHRPEAAAMTGRPASATQRGTVLAGVKATPYGWPTASLDPGCGRHRSAASGGRPERITRPRST